jgi:hypothetical protein
MATPEKTPGKTAALPIIDATASIIGKARGHDGAGKCRY